MGDRGGRTRARVRARMDGAAERRPLLQRRTFSHEPASEPVYSCVSNAHSHLPVYTNIYRIRRDIISIVEDYLSLEQLRDVRINVSVVRPLVDKLYEMDDISISAGRRFSLSSLSRLVSGLVSAAAADRRRQSTACWSTARSSCTSSRTSTTARTSTSRAPRCASWWPRASCAASTRTTTAPRAC